LAAGRTDALRIQDDVAIGTDFVGYRIEELIGQGGMGVVYRAFDLRLKRSVALKLIAPDLALDERFRDRFLRESELAVSLEHPNVVPIYDAGEVDGRLYLAMRYVEGTDLRVLLRLERPLDPERALRICTQVAAALDAAHARGLVHRDVKPSNVLLDPEEHAYLADFGLTRRLAEQGVDGVDGHSLGTPAYLAPEQVEGTDVDGRADVYSLGCLLYECLTGETPFPRGSMLAVAWAHLEDEPPNASECNRELPDAIDPVIRRALAKDPVDRPSTCTELLVGAERALGLRQSPVRHRRWLLAVPPVAILGVLAAVLGMELATGVGHAPPKSPLFGEDNTLVRVDPETNEVRAVVDVGQSPAAVTASGRSVWVYTGDPSVVEIDAATNGVRKRTPISAAPTDISFFSGPVIASDPGGAWLVGVNARGRGVLTRLLSSGRGKREYRLRYEPKAVAVRAGAVWVLGWGRRDVLLRIDADSGEVTKKTLLPTSSQATGLGVGAGAVWITNPSRATLYRVDARSGARTGETRLWSYASPPRVAFGSVWVFATRGSAMYVLDPRTLQNRGWVLTSVITPDDGPSTAGYGSTWGLDTTTGTVVRFDPDTKNPIATIRVTQRPVAFFGPPPTAIATGAGAVWVTVGQG
jgi:serine/threonine-protein kinase